MNKLFFTNLKAVEEANGRPAWRVVEAIAGSGVDNPLPFIVTDRPLYGHIAGRFATKEEAEAFCAKLLARPELTDQFHQKLEALDGCALRRGWTATEHHRAVLAIEMWLNLEVEPA